MSAAGHRAVAVRLARAAEQLIRASIELQTLDPRWQPDVMALNREADGYLEMSLDFHELAYTLERQESAHLVAA